MKNKSFYIKVFLSMFLFSAVTWLPQNQFEIKKAEAIAPTPAWWIDNSANFSQYDTYQFNNGRTHLSTYYPGYGTSSNILSANASYEGVAAIGPTGTVGGTVYTFFTPSSTTAELEWQCAELVKRFMYLKYGVEPKLANGNQIVDTYATNYPSNFYKITNDGSAKLYPKPGDVLSYGTSSPGHTALVKSVTGQSSGSATVELLEQNASSDGLTYQDFSNWQFQNGVDNDPYNSDTVTAWLTPLGWTNNSPSGSTADVINAVSASSPSNVWAVGREIPPSSYNFPVTYHYTGSSWTKVTPTSYASGAPNELLGVTTDSSGNAWAVGRYYSYPQILTLAYNWNGSSWVKKTSDNPSANYENRLNSVSMDNSGNIYAAGTYALSGGSNYQPLIEKWNGTKFAQQTISLPSGCTQGELNGISVRSSADVWAAGYVYCNPNTVYVIYHYDGSSWTSTVGPTSPRIILKSIKAVSSNEAWAVGFKSNSPTVPLILHYTTSGGWQEDTSNSFSVSTSSQLTSVDADSPNNVWAVGNLNGNALTLHYDGTTWTNVSTPTLASPRTLSGVAVNSGIGWVGGYTGSSTFTPFVLQSY